MHADSYETRSGTDYTTDDELRFIGGLDPEPRQRYITLVRSGLRKYDTGVDVDLLLDALDRMEPIAA